MKSLKKKVKRKNKSDYLKSDPELKKATEKIRMYLKNNSKSSIVLN